MLMANEIGNDACKLLGLTPISVVVGRNGSGKSQLLRSLSGILTGQVGAVVAGRRSRCYHAGQLSHLLLTLVAVPAVGLDVGLMALTERRPQDGDRQRP